MLNLTQFAGLCAVALTAFAPIAFAAPATKPAPAPVAPPAAPAPVGDPAADPALSHPANKAVTSLVGSIRYGKYTMALKFMDGNAQGAFLLGADWAKGDDKQRAEFVTLFHTLFAKVAFPKMQANFEHIQTAVYEPAVVVGNKATVKSTLVVLHALKKQEFKLKYQLLQTGADCKLVDVDLLGESMLTGVRNEQIVPIMKEGGWTNLLDLLRKKAKSLEGVPLK